MLNISFAWTSDALIQGRKTVTRRIWKDVHASKFKPGMPVEAWSRRPSWGGKRIGTIRIVDVRKESLFRMIDEPEYGKTEIQKEGGLWDTPGEFVAGFVEGGRVTSDAPDVWRVEFELLEVVNAEAKPA